jgi:hypothetical protein
MTPNEGRRKGQPAAAAGWRSVVHQLNQHVPIHLAGQPRALLTPPAEQQKSEADLMSMQYKTRDFRAER